MPILTPGQGRKSGRRWTLLAALLAVMPQLLAGTVYAYLRWGPVKPFEPYCLGSLQVDMELPATVVGPQPLLRISADRFSPENSWVVQVDDRYYSLRW